MFLNPSSCNSAYRLRYWNNLLKTCVSFKSFRVATVLTVYGIETIYLKTHLKVFLCCNSAYRLRYWNVSRLNAHLNNFFVRCNSAYRLRYWNRLEILNSSCGILCKLQQCLPFTVLKRSEAIKFSAFSICCNSAYRLRYWNKINLRSYRLLKLRCNSAYRLRYWNLKE